MLAQGLNLDLSQGYPREVLLSSLTSNIFIGPGPKKRTDDYLIKNPEDVKFDVIMNYIGAHGPTRIDPVSQQYKIIDDFLGKRAESRRQNPHLVRDPFTGEEPLSNVDFINNIYKPLVMAEIIHLERNNGEIIIDRDTSNCEYNYREDGRYWTNGARTITQDEYYRLQKIVSLVQDQLWPEPW